MGLQNFVSWIKDTQMYKAPPDKKLIKVSTPIDLRCFRIKY